MSKPIIRFENVTKQFDQDPPILKDVSFEIEQGKFYTLLGPSGCGKTTILRLVAGFMEPTEGKIYFNNKVINHVPANRRQVNTVFQDYALFPHLNVFENVAFGLRIKKMKKPEIDRKVKKPCALSIYPAMNIGKFKRCQAGSVSGLPLPGQL